MIIIVKKFSLKTQCSIDMYVPIYEMKQWAFHVVFNNNTYSVYIPFIVIMWSLDTGASVLVLLEQQPIYQY